MFTKQISKLLGIFRQEGWNERELDAFSQLGNCQQELEHRGPATFAGPNPPAGATTGYALNIPSGSTLNMMPGSNLNVNGTMTGSGGVPIGGVIMFDSAAAIPTGWILWGEVGKFPRIGATPGGTGGSNTHNHTGTTGSTQATNLEAETGITIPEHVHTFAIDVAYAVPGDPELGGIPVVATVGGETPPGTATTSNVILTPTDPKHNHTQDPHVHSISDDNNVPEYIDIVFIKRIF